MSVSTTILEYRGLRLGIASADATALTWLQEFLAPAFSVCDSGPVACSIEVVADEAAYHTAVRRGPQRNGEHVACFAFDNGPLRLPRWTADGDERCIWDDVAKVFYCLNANGSQVRVLIDRPRPSRRIGLMRPVRELAISRSWSQRSIVMHGASLVMGAAGIVIVGAQGSGKTTLLTHLLLRDRLASFISNDRVVMVLDDTNTALCGMPTVVQIQSPTFALFPMLRQRLLPEWDHRLSLHERSASVADADDRQAHQLTPAQFCTLVDTPMRGHSRADVVLFPRIDAEREGIDIQPVASSLAAARLRQHLLGGPFPCVSEVFGPSTTTVDTETLDRICRELATRLRCFDCVLGRNAYQADFPSAALAGTSDGDPHGA